MLKITLALIVALVSPALVVACEGECIIGITNAFLSNYSTPINSAFGDVVGQIVAEFFPERRYASPPMFLVKPMLEAYRKHAYDRLENSIFPSYFHGKCQRPDPNSPNAPPTNPPGCPNPDCSVVCGTPGSLVHFYPTLRLIVFKETRDHLKTIATPGTEPFKAVEKQIAHEMGKGGKFRTSKASRLNFAGTRTPKLRRLAQKRTNEKLQDLMSKLPGNLERVCGGKASDAIDALPKCSWETTMKQYILSYP